MNIPSGEGIFFNNRRTISITEFVVVCEQIACELLYLEIVTTLQKHLMKIIGNTVKNERSYTHKERIKDTKQTPLYQAF